ncbi:uncharacterized protein LOC129943096 isoform X2 [Eupeodes corollae]|uniref:uncharacterized protein LOC129943096 isoform X2 n=1 Tax=Eupeodes corollae TaxID=290404 RepID=UPI002492FEE3|nr:uncharacterized protein LOC129943096 isoform X2 [Eupeodes corollae]
MKVNLSVIWVCSLSVVFLCIFEFGSTAKTSVGRPPTSSTTATTPVHHSRSSRKQPKTSNNANPTVSRPSTPKPSREVSGGSFPKSIRQLDIPTERRKTTNPKKYTTEGKLTFLESTVAGPTKVDFPKPTFSIPEKRSTKNSRNSNKLACPRENEVKFDLFPRKCERNKDCNSRTSNEICCSIFGAKSCVGGLPKPLEESTHSPIFGIIPRHCPQRPLAELWWEVKTCETDMDCWPRVCCPDGQRRYCRSSKPELDIVPVPVKRSINYLSEYLECTPAPPPIFDLHPKPCNSTIDCFPNVCCQEAGKKHCRPPKKSVLTFMANFLNLGLVKRLTKNLVIK